MTTEGPEAILPVLPGEPLSGKNQRVRDAVALLRRKTRDTTGRYLLEGPKSIVEAVLAGEVDHVFLNQSGALHLENAMSAHGQMAWPEGDTGVSLVDDFAIAELTHSTTPQGVVAVARQRRATWGDVLNGVAIALCQVNDPGNAGAVIRTARSFGAAGVVFTAGSVDPWNPKSVRAAAGALGHINVLSGVADDEMIREARAAGHRVVAFDSKSDQELARHHVTPPVLLAFGSESHGLPEAVASAADATVRVPQPGGGDSLNLAATVAVVTYIATSS